MFLSKYSSNIIESRSGLAPLTGKMLLPSQFLGPDEKRSQKIMAEAADYYGDRLQSVSVPVDDTTMEAFVLWPEGWDRGDLSRCIVYSNPNGVTVPQVFEEGVLGWTPAEVMEAKRVPMIFYDYRGSGVNKKVKANRSFIGRCSSTYASVVLDGEAALKCAKEQLGFENVTMWGSSLGGGVASVAVERYLKKRNWQPLAHISIVNHDSFTTTARVALPYFKKLADFLGSLVGIQIDAQKSMKNLVNRGLKVTVLCHLGDPVIPRGARMAELFSNSCPENVKVFCSSEYGHAHLSFDMLLAIKEMR